MNLIKEFLAMEFFMGAMQALREARVLLETSLKTTEIPWVQESISRLIEKLKELDELVDQNFPPNNENVREKLEKLWKEK